jgi:hypothetical protein
MAFAQRNRTPRASGSLIADVDVGHTFGANLHASGRMTEQPGYPGVEANLPDLPGASIRVTIKSALAGVNALQNDGANRAAD